jgi:hypothetical protein
VLILQYTIVCLTAINVQKKILKNPVFKSTISDQQFFSRCKLIYDIQVISHKFIDSPIKGPQGAYTIVHIQYEHLLQLF